MIRFFAWQLLLALDQLVNVLFGGYADEYANITTGGNRNETWRYDPAMLFAVLVSHGRIVQACDAVKNKTPLLA